MPIGVLGKRDLYRASVAIDLFDEMYICSWEGFGSASEMDVEERRSEDGSSVDTRIALLFASEQL